jgi:MFS family permease
VKEDARSLRLLAGLAALNVLGYVDRQLVVALAPLLIADLGLTRADVGLLVGVAFIPVFAVASLVVGVLADRVPRPRLIAGGLVAWSAATALTATASGLPSIAAWRAGVGVGEATLPPTALAMLGDRFPARRLGLASGVFYAGIPVGFAISFVLAGWIGPWLGWRACFLVLGTAGLGAVLAVNRMADPPRRPGTEARRPGEGSVRPGATATARAILSVLRGDPALLLVVLGATLLAFTSSASQHAITWLVEERGFAYARAAFLSGAFVAAAGLAGSLSIGWLTDRARARHPAGRLLAFAALGSLGLAAAAAFYRLAPASSLFFPAWFLAQAWMLGWFGPALAAVDESAPPGRRATMLGFCLLTVNLLGVATGPWVTGVIGDRAGLTRGLLASVGVGALGLLLVTVAGLLQYRRAGSSRPPVIAFELGPAGPREDDR